MDLYLGYETCEPWSLTVKEPDDPEDDSVYRIDARMRWAGCGTATGNWSTTAACYTSTTDAASRGSPTKLTCTR